MKSEEELTALYDYYHSIAMECLTNQDHIGHHTFICYSDLLRYILYDDDGAALGDGLNREDPLYYKGLDKHEG